MNGLFESIRSGMRNLKIRDKFLIPTLFIVFIIILAIGFLIFYKSNAIIEQKTKEYAIDILHEVGKNIDFQLQEINNLYYSIFTSNIVQVVLHDANKGFDNKYDEVASRREVESYLLASILGRDAIESVYLFSNSGKVFGASLAAQQYKLSENEKREIAAGQGRLVWLDPDPERLTIPAGAAVHDLQSQKQIGYILISLRETALFDIYSQIRLFSNGELYIINKSGQIVSHVNKRLLASQVNEPNLTATIQQAATGFIPFKDAGKRYYLTYYTMPKTQWKIINKISSVQYERESIVLKRWIILILSTCFVLVIPLSIFVSNRISRPIRELSSIMESVEHDGSDVHFAYQSRDEVGVLGCNFNNMIKHINYLIHQVYQEQMRYQKAQLKYLMFQINPHFLFNTLETIHWAAIMNGAPEVGKISKLLGDLIREGLKGDEFVTVEREISNIKKYATIQKYRYGDKLEICIDITPGLLSYHIPKFLIQPLVENAITHGLEPKIDKGIVVIGGTLKKDKVIFTVKDNGIGMDNAHLDYVISEMLKDEVDEIKQIGLSNVHHRMQLYFGKEAGLSLQSEPNVGTTVTASIPLDTIRPQNERELQNKL